MIGFRSDHAYACIMHKSETDWMHARGQPASARAWPAASGQLAGFHFAIARVLEYLREKTRETKTFLELFALRKSTVQ